MTIEEDVRDFARTLGFAAVGFTTADPFPEAENVMLDRLERGLLSGLPWFTASRAIASCHPRSQMPEARSIISFALPYIYAATMRETSKDQPRGTVSRYGWGPDYHEVLRQQLEAIVQFIYARTGQRVPARIFVDSGWLAERAVAARSGVGWFGKNGNIVTDQWGSWIFLGEILIAYPFVTDEPALSGCGSCDLCLRACPTGALSRPYEVGSSRCLSFLTVEWKGSIPSSLRPKVGNRIFGCDACQEACPQNQHRISLGQVQPDFNEGDWPYPLLRPLLTLSDEEFRRRFRKSALRRAKRTGLQRNVVVALGNLGDRGAVPALEILLTTGENALREHAAWALGQIGGPGAKMALERAAGREVDPTVLAEIRVALELFDA